MAEFTREGMTIAYAEAGDAESPAVVLLHGFTSDQRMWSPVVGTFSEDYRVIAPDMRGHGASTAPADLESYAMEAYAEDISALLDWLGVDVCAMAGCSFGGMVALQFATTWPERVAGLVLSDTSAGYDHPEYDEKYRKREAGIDAQCDTVERFGTSELGKRAAANVSDSFLAAGIRERFARLSREGYLGAAQARRQRPNLLPILRERLAMPVLICIGEDDPVLSASNVMARELPDARRVLFRNTGHGIPALKPEMYAREVMQFFDDIEEDREVAGSRSVG